LRGKDFNTTTKNEETERSSPVGPQRGRKVPQLTNPIKSIEKHGNGIGHKGRYGAVKRPTSQQLTLQRSKGKHGDLLGNRRKKRG